jgi:hypothetical protein
MFTFPDHKGSLTLNHNDNLSCYQTVKEEIERDRHNGYRDENWVSVEEKKKAIETNEIWTFQWHGKSRDDFAQKHASSLEALITSFGLPYTPIEFPEHKASLYLSHNEHLGNYDTVKEQIWDEDYYADDDWVTPEEKQKAIDTNELWTLHWYPDTPVGFCLYHASTLEALMSVFKEDKNHAQETQ